MPSLPYQTSHENDLLFPRVLWEADRLTITWPVRQRSSRAFATAFALTGALASLAMLGWLPHPLDHMAFKPPLADGRAILWISRAFRLMFAIGLPINLWHGLGGLWTMFRWDSRGQVVVVGDGRITKEWVGTWGPRRQWRPMAAVTGINWRPYGRLRRGGRVERVTIRFRTGRPMRFGLWGRTREPLDVARNALPALIGPAATVPA